MKKVILILLAMFFVSTVNAGYVWETWDEGRFGSKDIRTDEAIEILGGGGVQLNLIFNSIGVIKNTDATGIHEIVINHDSLLYLSGGNIDWISSFQGPRYSPPDNPVGPEHIFIDCLDWNYNTNTDILSGHWGDNSQFNILLVQGSTTTYPVIDNIKFVPEPATLALLGIGGLLIRRRKK